MYQMSRRESRACTLVRHCASVWRRVGTLERGFNHKRPQLPSPPAFASPLLPSGSCAAFASLAATHFSTIPTFPPLRTAYCSFHRDAMGVDFFSGRGVGFGFGIGCGFGIGWGFGGAPLNVLGVGAGGGCGIGLGLGWGFGAAYGTKYLDSKLRFEGIDFDKVKGEHLDQRRLEESSTKQLN